ncbi:flippase-like domain-containing protein [Candidatus Saccharibacteria bacterium]|nr:flippase-like domain-containing protein [Candidatus Saccharibacteria bacterium]
MQGGTVRKSGFSKKKIRKILTTILFIGFSAGVIIATAVNEFSNNKNAAELAEVHIDGWLVLPAALCFLVMINLEYGKCMLMMKKSSNEGDFSKKELFKIAFRTVMIGRYYDKITPAAVGGQPAQIMQMRKTGKISNGMATAIPIFSMISGQIAFMLVAIPVFLFSDVASRYPVLVATAWVGLIFYAFWPVMVVGTMFLPKPTAKLINFVVRILAKIRIIKNRDLVIKTVEKEVGDYARNVKRLTKRPAVFGGVILMSLISNTLASSIPYFVLKAFGGDIGYFECFCLTVGVEAAVYFIPTPGNSGVAEGTFYMVFSRLSTGYVFWAMMLWRFFSYYIYIIVGPFIYLSQHLEKKRGNK